MNFDFSEQQKLVQSEARKFLRAQCSNELVRELMDDDDRHYDQDLWQQVVGLGWPALAIPEAQGGHGLGYLELCVLAQELGRSLAPIPFSSTVYLLAEALKSFGSDQQQQQWLPRIAAGEIIGCVATLEHIGQSITDLPACVVTDGCLSGSKLAVVDGQSADLAVVSAQDEKQQYNLYLLDLDQPGVSRSTVKTLDPSRPQANLQFDNAQVALLGKVSEGALQLAGLYDRAAVLFAFEQLGGCEAVIRMGLKYTNERYAFGRPVASFQAIKHKFADMYVAKEIATANAYYAAWALSNNAPELSLAAATARVSAIDAYFLCSKENLQAHGGMGYTWEFDCHLHYRRAQHLSLNLGSGHYWKEQLARELLAGQTIAAQA